MARRKGRRSFGSVRHLPSGRWQARYRDLAGKSHTAPQTFSTRPEAARFLAQVETDLARGEWTDPRAGRVSFAEWAARWQDTTTNLRPNTRALHDYGHPQSAVAGALVRRCRRFRVATAAVHG